MKTIQIIVILFIFIDKFFWKVRHSVFKKFGLMGEVNKLLNEDVDEGLFLFFLRSAPGWGWSDRRRSRAAVRLAVTPVAVTCLTEPGAHRSSPMAHRP